MAAFVHHGCACRGKATDAAWQESGEGAFTVPVLKPGRFLEKTAIFVQKRLDMGRLERYNNFVLLKKDIPQ